MVPSRPSAEARASATVAAEHSGSVLLVGDMSAKSGGFISGHRSHRSGRDVDLGFFAVETGGRRREAPELIPFDRFGAGFKGNRTYMFDAKRNWRLVEALLSDPEAKVQWIFVSDGLKALLLKWALDNGRDVELVRRAASVLHQPSDSAPHDDHFHVRIYCHPRHPHCQDTGPAWPWIDPPPQDPLRFTDDEILELAFGE